jgi:2-haloacid dehalogenase
MALTLAFDVYGTLIDTSGVTLALQQHVGDRAGAFARLWREKQLEYSFRRGLMQRYEPFTVCTQNALDYACVFFAVELTETDKAQLMTAYRTLPAFAEVADGLQMLQTAGYRMYAFSNGYPDDVENLLQHANIRDQFIGVISVHEVQSFKPDPAVYEHFLQRTGAQPDEAWLISSNPFDVIGAINVGMQAAWVKRTPDALFDPWGIKPTVTVSGLTELSTALSA